MGQRCEACLAREAKHGPSRAVRWRCELGERRRRLSVAHAGAVPSTPTVWRAPAEAGEAALGRVHAAVVVAFRRHWWARPGGFAWLTVPGRS